MAWRSTDADDKSTPLLAGGERRPRRWLSPEEILFPAFAGGDAAGAKLFGYPTFWVNRRGQPAEALGAMADGTGAGMADLVRFVLARA
jgi:2-haloacid dehalogenase